MIRIKDNIMFPLWILLKFQILVPMCVYIISHFCFFDYYVYYPPNWCQNKWCPKFIWEKIGKLALNYINVYFP